MSKKNIKPKTYKYPDPDKIQINKASFELKLRDYKENIKNRITWNEVLFLIPAWAVLFTAKFDSVWIFSGEVIKGTYFAFMVLGTLNLIKNKITVIRNILNGNNDVSEVIENITKECK